MSSDIQEKTLIPSANDMDDLQEPCSSSSLNQKPLEKDMEEKNQSGEGKVVELRSPKTAPMLPPEVMIVIVKLHLFSIFDSLS